MSKDWDQDDFSRADQIIELANFQLQKASEGEVSASLMFAAARFNSWVSATGFADGPDMESMKDQTIEYFVAKYREALMLNLNDYIENFATLMSEE